MGERQKVYRSQVVGNNALNLDAGYVSPLRQPKQQPVVQPMPKQRIKDVYRVEPRVDVNYDRINRLCTIVLAFVIIATLGVCVLFLKTQFSYGQLNEEIESVKRELNIVKRENVQLEDDLAAMIDLESIYEVATTELNMRLPGPGDVYYIESEPVSYTTKFGPVKVEEEKISLGNIFGYITKGW